MASAEITGHGRKHKSFEFDQLFEAGATPLEPADQASLEEMFESNLKLDLQEPVVIPEGELDDTFDTTTLKMTFGILGTALAVTGAVKGTKIILEKKRKGK